MNGTRIGVASSFGGEVGPMFEVLCYGCDLCILRSVFDSV
jgi:hypothetical protein